MEGTAVSAATGAIKTVLGKLNAFLGDEYTLPEGSQSDIELIISKLKPMHSVLPGIWGREDIDAPCKDWMMEVRELSYDTEDAIDEFIQQRTNTSPFEDLKIKVNDVSERFCEKWKTAETISNSSKPVVVDPRARFLHKDASELVGMDKLDELIELLGQGFDKRRDASRRRIGTPHHETTQRKQKIVIMVQMACEKCRSKAMALVAATGGVDSVALAGEGKDQVVVVGDDLDSIKLTSALRKKVGPAQLVEVGYIYQKPAPVNAVDEHPVAACGYQQFDEVKMLCILGFAGGGKTTLADLLYHAMREQFQFRAFVSVSRSPNMTDILRSILTQVTNVPYAGTEAVSEQNLINNISNFLADKRYLVIIDDIWHWEEWEIIIESLTKNNLGSRIITTTRITAIAEKCRTDNDAIVYEIGGLSAYDAAALSERVINGAWKAEFNQFADESTRYAIAYMCGGIPSAVICMSLAVAEQLQPDSMSRATRVASTVTLSRVRDGFLNNPYLRPLLESLCLGYHDLPLHMKTCLLHCSTYPGYDRFERDICVRRWIAEGFVYEEEAAEGCFDELVNRRLIEPVRDSEYDIHTSSKKNYEIHTIMLAFLRCKSQQDNFVTCLGYETDISSLRTARRIRRLSVQYQLDSLDFPRIDLSHTRSLYVFGYAKRVPFKHFQRLRVLELEDTEDLEDAHLVDICELLWLRYLGLKGTPISELPPQIGGLQHLETLDIRDTKVRELPWDAGQICKSVRVLAGDKHSRQGVKLPEGVCQDLKNGIPASSLAKCREVLSIVVFDRFGLGTVPPLVGVFKVHGRHMRIPPLIKEYFKVLSSLDIRLCKLGEDDVKFLGKEMPNLQTLVVRFEVLPREPIPISGEDGFARLESFCVDSRVPRVTFEPGAMPNLKLLAFKFYAGPASEDPVGITNLGSLEKVVFRCSPLYKSDSPGISATVAVVRREAKEHPNRITLCINDKEEIFLQGCRDVNKYAGSSGAIGIEAEADMLSADRNNLAGNDQTKEIFHDNKNAIASCSRAGEIEEVEAQ